MLTFLFFATRTGRNLYGESIIPNLSRSEVEIDVHMTKDSAIVIMHDDTLDRTTTGKGLVSDYTLEQIKQLNLKSPIGVVTRQKVPTLEEVLDLCNGKVLIQVDKWQPIKAKVIEIIRKYKMQKQIILRGTFKQ